jgi:hypothetical protein
MTSTKTKQDRARQAQVEANGHWGRKHIAKVFWFFIGAIASLVFIHGFVYVLPGPDVTVNLQGLRVRTGNAAGCIAYNLSIETTADVENVHARLQLENTIQDLKFGFAQAAYDDAAGNTMGMQVFDVRRDEKGLCKEILPIDTTETTSSYQGNAMRVGVSSLPASGVIVGGIVTSSTETSVNPASKHFEGSYEYTKLGQVVRRPLTLHDEGFSDVK